MRFLYTIALSLLQPLVLLRLLIKSRIAPAYRQRILERYGVFAPKLDACIWLHAVSVGEAITARPVIEYLLRQYPDIPIVVTTTTPTGAERVCAMFGERVLHRYMPQDLPWCLAYFIGRIQPKILIIMETELWPNVIALCRRRAIPTLLANGRLSARSAQSYAKFGGLTAAMLAQMDALCIQTETERERFVALGARADACHVMPSLKFEANVTSAHHAAAQALREQWGLAGRFVWLAASTHVGEETMVLNAHRQLLEYCPEALLVLVPRHPERFDSVAKLCVAAQLQFVRWSDSISPGQASVVLVDAMGQLMSLYGIGNAAFVGGSLNGGGGHNIMEPALWAKPVLSGPGLFNFQAVSDAMIAAEGLWIVGSAEALAEALIKLQSPELQQYTGRRAEAVALRNRGGLDALLAVINHSLEGEG